MWCSSSVPCHPHPAFILWVLAKLVLLPNRRSIFHFLSYVRFSLYVCVGEGEIKILSREVINMRFIGTSHENSPKGNLSAFFLLSTLMWRLGMRIIHQNSRLMPRSTSPTASMKKNVINITGVCSLPWILSYSFLKAPSHSSGIISSHDSSFHA